MAGTQYFADRIHSWAQHDTCYAPKGIAHWVMRTLALHRVDALKQ